ncbi:hypothetical protein [Coprobacter tertius]|uniref:DUF5115 domain-containing protein n=1 Tax=Coprobacter tertius TaxID=2944915 RepID=A0ABT1MIS6_9BACT|nr:hypothetical protein [Coprobacter tertius]MCP9612520.1 hypothetical protein [Coprobacter tertius]
MKKEIYLFVILLTVTIGIISCNDDGYPDNPTIVSPLSGLILTVNGEDYTAVPQLLENGSLSRTYILSVKKPATTAVVKYISVADAGTSVNISVGSTVTFVDNKFQIVLSKEDRKETYDIEMVYNPPPFLYVVKSGDKDKSGNKYYLDTEKAPRIASADYDDKYEGYIDLTKTDWDNIGLVQSDKGNYFDVSAGLSGSQSFGSFTLVMKESPGTGYFPCDGPWGNWKTTADNSDIVSPGIWKIDFDAATNQMTLLETQWAITGSATSSLKAMTYIAESGKWSLTTELSEGSIKFTTIPVNSDDPVIVYGVSDGLSKLSEDGGEIMVEAAGTYTVEMDLSQSPFYDYTLIKN